MTRVASLLLTLLIANTAAATVAPRSDYDGRSRLVLGVTVSGHVMLSAGIERLATEHLSLRMELLWAIADVPAFGLQAGGSYRFRIDGASQSEDAPTGRWGLFSVGALGLLARESPGHWRTLTLPLFSPGLRWGLGDSGGLDVELPIAWMAQQHKPMPLGVQTRWWANTPPPHAQGLVGW